jgi:hypothetical protein
MGWEHEHLFSFTIFGERYFDDGFSSFTFSAKDSQYRLGKIKLDGLGLENGSRFTYMYDMGDSWDHVLKVLDTDYVPKVPGQEYGCFKGARACPPEDCGGVYGYYNLLEALADPDHEDHEDRMDWAGGQIDPEAFDFRDVDFSLRCMR